MVTDSQGWETILPSMTLFSDYISKKVLNIMPYMLVQHKVENFAKWKAVFDSKLDLRQMNGEKSAQILHDADDHNSLTLLFEWDTLENARQYAQNPDLKAAMQEAGVTGPPDIAFLNEG
jgi:hypothetical protein